ncbi:MAG: iron ABC transporter permease [Dialister sp.]|nr:iron ABC transporter permease [Dialister sp.]
MTFSMKLRMFFRKPYNVILVLLFAALILLTFLPLLSIVLDTVTVHSSEVMRIRGSHAGDFTDYHWTKVLLDGTTSMSIFYKPLWNTVLISLSTCAIAIFFGGGMAWLITRTDIKYKPFLSVLFVVPYIMPSWTLALAWLNFFRNSLVGGVPGLFTVLTGIPTPNWFAYGFFPISIVQGLHYAPFAYILIGGILKHMDASLEEAAQLLHASRWQIMKRITLPMVKPALLSTFLLAFSSSMSAFAVPAFLGAPVRYHVLTTQLYRTLQGLNPGYGYVMALILILIGVAIMMVNQKVLSGRKSYTTITGKSANVSLIPLRGLRLPISLLLALLLVCVTVVPLITFAVESFIVEPGNYSLSNFSTVFWIGDGATDIANGEPGILKNHSIYNGLLNSFLLSVVCAFLTGTIGLLAGYAIVRKKGSWLSAAVNHLTFFPYLIPSMAFGAIYLSMFSTRHGPIPALYGTFAILALIGTVKYLPFASRAGVNSMLQLGNEIEEAGIIMGISWWKRMIRIIIPIQKTSILSGYLLPYISCMRELSLFILLISPSTAVLTTMLFQYNEKGWNQYANAINLLIVLVVLLSNWVINKLTGASIDKGIG